MEVELTWDDVANGVRYSYSGCPVALAINRVSGSRCKVWGDGLVEVGVKKYHLSHEVVNAILNFDRYGVMQPMKFELVKG